MSQRPTPWLLREPLADTEARLYCLPYSGTGASSFRHWPQRLGPVEVCPLQPPGRENRIGQPAHEHVEAWVTDAADGLAEHLDRPYALFGHCTGALLAHALAVRLQVRNVRPPGRLFVSSCRVPHWPPSCRYRPPQPGLTGVYHPSMSDEQFADEVRRIALVLGGDNLLPELVPLAVRVLRADVEMCFRYAPPNPEPLRCPITAISWRDDSDVGVDDMRAWDRYGTVRHHLLDGDKLTYLTAPPAMLDVLEQDLTPLVPA